MSKSRLRQLLDMLPSGDIAGDEDERGYNFENYYNYSREPSSQDEQMQMAKIVLWELEQIIRFVGEHKLQLTKEIDALDNAEIDEYERVLGLDLNYYNRERARYLTPSRSTALGPKFNTGDDF